MYSLSPLFCNELLCRLRLSRLNDEMKESSDNTEKLGKLIVISLKDQNFCSS